MQRSLLLSACVLTCAGFLPLPALSDGTGASAASTPPPQIYHVVTTALCARLHERVRPAVAMILQNDQSIAKSPPLFKKYQRGALTAIGPAYPNGNGAPATSDSVYNHSPETDMALQQMSYLVIPVARNIIAAQTILDDEKLLAPTGSPADDAKLAQIKAQLLETIAFQNASLDLINGFVATQQMGELQHYGEELLSGIQGRDTTLQLQQAKPNQWQDPNTPGLPPNPYAFDPATVPGLAVGYNPLQRIMDGMTWLQVEEQKREGTAGATISAALAECGK
ncbi:MAG: hypothetical protein JO190_06330 [Candidatus Eremiobacteraeota bacterium]|nr:hypothetical protein [Candidatus Eremiobacteraeota bacterium]MBV8499146.1 hypothetical protein [Candidatus Eremiobacteraeota bacterium]